MNIPGLILIEYTEADQTAVPVYTQGEVLASAFSGDFIPVDFVISTGGFTDNKLKDEAGNLYHVTELVFFVPDTLASTRNEMDELVESRVVFRVTDPQGVAYVIGDQNHPARTVYTMTIDPTHTGRKGYQVTATATNTHGALVYSTTTESSAS